jgi:hypothetical protein
MGIVADAVARYLGIYGRAPAACGLVAFEKEGRRTFTYRDSPTEPVERLADFRRHGKDGIESGKSDSRERVRTAGKGKVYFSGAKVDRRRSRWR